nr:hypothetical protein Iba_chr11aCG10190 [Ipomoea batatas]
MLEGEDDFGEVEADDGGGKDAIVLTVAEDVEVAAGTVRHRPAENVGVLGGAEGKKGWSGSWRQKRERTEISQWARRSASAAKERDLSTTLSAKRERAEGLSNLELQGLDTGRKAVGNLESEEGLRAGRGWR